MKRIIVCGSRDFADRDFLFWKMDEVVEDLEGEFELVEGGARGADKLAGEWARQHKKWGMTATFKANWDVYGRGAGMVRNQTMAVYAGMDGLCVAFRKAVGKSNGTDDMVKKARAVGMKVIVYRR